MEKEIKFYVVRASFGAVVYENLDFAKEEVRYILRNAHSSELIVTIECWTPLLKLTKGWQWVSYNKRRIATRYAFDNSTEDRRLELLAKDFAKTHGAGYMRQEVYVVSNRGAAYYNSEFYGSLNGRPIDVDFLRGPERSSPSDRISLSFWA